MQATRNIIAFAFIKDRFEASGDIVDGLLPLFAPVIGRRRGQPFDPNIFAADVDEFYGLKIHAYVVEYLAPRLEAASLLKRTTSNNAVVQYVNLGDSDHPRTEQDGRLEAILNELMRHVEERLQGTNLSMRAEEIEQGILSRLLRFDPHLPNFEPAPDPQRPKTLSLNKAPTPDPEVIGNPREEALDVAFASFALRLHSQRPGDFNMLADIAAGALVSEVVLSFRTPPKIIQDLATVHAFLDGPLLLDLLDLTTPEQHDFTKALIESLARMGLKLATFEHSATEAENILGKVIRLASEHKEVTGDLGWRLAFDGMALARFRVVHGAFRDKLMELGVTTVDVEKASEFWPYRTNVRNEHEDALISAIRPSAEFQARKVDAQSAIWTMRIVRSKPQVANVLGLAALFISKNVRLIDTLLSYGRRNSLLSDQAASPFLTDRYAAALAWVALGGAGREIPVRRLVANCMAAVAPRKDVVVRMRSVLRELAPASADDFEILMRDRRCAHVLMDRTLGDAKLVTPSNANSLLEEIRRSTAEEVAQEKDRTHQQELAAKNAEIQRREIEQQNELAQRQQDITKLQEEVRSSAAAAEALRKQANGRIDALEREVSRRDTASVRKCVVEADHIGAVAIVISALIMAGAVALVSSFVGGSTAWTLLSTIAVVTISALGIWSVPDILFGKKIKSLKQWAYKRKLRERGMEELAARYCVEWNVGASRMEQLTIPPSENQIEEDGSPPEVPSRLE